MIMPGSWAGLLETFRPVFRRRGTFVLFTVLATGMVASTGRRSVVGMLSGAQMAGTISFHAACRFFSSAVWDLDQMGRAAAPGRGHRPVRWRRLRLPGPGYLVPRRAGRQ
jgi:hypothetical protein